MSKEQKDESIKLVKDKPVELVKKEKTTVSRVLEEKPEEKKEAKKIKKEKKSKIRQHRKRSKRYLALKKEIKIQKYPIEEAVKLAKKTSTTKFDGSIEVHARLGIDMGKSDQMVRGSVKFPNATGRKIKIAAFVEEQNEKACKEAGAEIIGGEELIKKIKETKQTGFDISVAEPKMMPKLGQIAKILGPKGLMPTPKNQTVSITPEKTIKELMSGKTAFKNDANGIIHLMIGKASFDSKKLVDNLNTFLKELKKLKPEKVKGNFIRNLTVCSTMGPGIKVKI